MCHCRAFSCQRNILALLSWDIFLAACTVCACAVWLFVGSASSKRAAPGSPLSSAEHIMKQLQPSALMGRDCPAPAQHCPGKLSPEGGGCPGDSEEGGEAAGLSHPCGDSSRIIHPARSEPAHNFAPHPEPGLMCGCSGVTVPVHPWQLWVSLSHRGLLHSQGHSPNPPDSHCHCSPRRGRGCRAL